MPTDTGPSVLDRVREWPEERRREAERLLEAMEHAGETVCRLSDEERVISERPWTIRSAGGATPSRS